MLTEVGSPLFFIESGYVSSNSFSAAFDNDSLQ